MPNCYSDLERILDALGEKRTELLGDISRSEYIIQFLTHNKYPGEQLDLASSLILLEGSDDYKIRSDLHFSPELQTLPRIRRTGKSTPSMLAPLLGLEGDYITDPDLQRTKSLFLSTKAAVEEWLHLIFRILEMKKPPRFFHFSEEKLDGLGDKMAVKNKVWFEKLKKIINVKPLPTNNNLKFLIKDLINKRLFEAGIIDEKTLPEQLDQIIQLYLTWHIKRLTDDQREQQNIPHKKLEKLWKNLHIALFFALDTTPYKFRHLGDYRLLEKIKYSPSEAPKNFVFQGFGDLSMNEWNVAFYHENGKPKVFIPINEPFVNRTYHCLVVWKHNIGKNLRLSNNIKEAIYFIDKEKMGITLNQDVSITELNFLNKKPYIIFPEKDSSFLELDELVDFAVFGKLILRDGQVVKPEEIVEQFKDIRHFFLLPNINPDISKIVQDTKNILLESFQEFQKFNSKDWKTICQELKLVIDLKDLQTDLLIGLAEQILNFDLISENLQKSIRSCQEKLNKKLDKVILFLVENYSEISSFIKRPRDLFGQQQTKDVWLLENALLESRSLQHLACNSTIAVDLLNLGTSKVWIDFCLIYNGYSKKEENHLFEVQNPGDFTWDTSGDHPRLNIRLKMNTYPCTIIGIGDLENPIKDSIKDEKNPKRNTLYLLAWGHDFKRGGHTLWDCAKVLQAAGARYALVIDEGQDVFQVHIENNQQKSIVEFLQDEHQGKDLHNWMPVPIAYKPATETKPLTLKRQGLRASIAFWQEKKIE